MKNTLSSTTVALRIVEYTLLDSVRVYDIRGEMVTVSGKRVFSRYHDGRGLEYCLEDEGAQLGRDLRSNCQ